MAYKLTDTNWNDDWSCTVALRLLLSLIDDAIPEQPRLESLAREMRTNLVAAKEAFPAHRDVFGLVQFAIGTRMMIVAAEKKIMNSLWWWTIGGLCDLEFEKQVEVNFSVRITELRDSNREWVRQNFIETLVTWCPPFYYAAGKIGHPLSELAVDLYPFFLPRFIDTIVDSHQATARLATDIVAACLNWDALKGAPFLGEAHARQLHDAYRNSALSDECRKRIGMLFSTRAGEVFGFDLVTEARYVLEACRETLVGHETLQLICAMVVAEKGDISSYEPELAAAIRVYRGYLDESPEPAYNIYDTGAIFGSMVPMLTAYLRSGRLDIATRLLGLWKCGEEVDYDHEKPMVCLSEFFRGVGYASRLGFFSSDLSLDARQQEYRRLVEAENIALGSAHDIRHDPEFVLKVPERFGQPSYDDGPAFDAVLRASYLPEKGWDFIHASIEISGSLTILPYHAYPLQALFVKQFGITVPFCCSWRPPLPDREIKRALIYADGPVTSDVELGELSRIFEAGRIDYVLITSGPSAKKEFLRHFESDEFDLIWVLAHGEFDKYAPLDSHIPVADGERVHVDEMASRAPKGDRRRLLVLNICSGAAGASLGGLPDIGIGPTLATASQAVISHLWPVWMWAPVCFGSLLASALTKHRYFDAFIACMRILTAGGAAITRELRATGAAESLADRCERMHEEWDNILHWGSPVFLQ